MHSYYRRHSLRNRSSSQPSPPKEFGRRTRYENQSESIREEDYYRRGPSPRRLPYSSSRDRDYDEQQDYIDRQEASVVQRTESRNKPPYITTETQRALWLSYYPDYEDDESLEPNTTTGIAKKSADGETKDEK